MSRNLTLVLKGKMNISDKKININILKTQYEIIVIIKY